MNFSLIEHPAAWTADEARRHPDLQVTIDALHVDAMDRALATAREHGLTPADYRAEYLPLDGLDAALSSWKRQLNDGIGMVWLRGLPIERYSVDEWEMLFRGMGERLGVPVSQSNLGDLVGHVINVGGKDSRERAYRNNRALAVSRNEELAR